MEEVSEIKVIPVERLKLRSSPAPPSPSPLSPPPLQPPPLPVERQKPRPTTQRSVSRNEKAEVKRTRARPLASTPPPPPPTPRPPPPPIMQRSKEEYVRIERKKVIPVDIVKLRSTPAPPSPSPLSPPPPQKSPAPPSLPPPAERQRPRRATYQSVSREEKAAVQKTRSPALASTPPPPTPTPMMQRSEEKCVRIERKKSNATKEIKTVLAPTYNQKEKKKTVHDDSLRPSHTTAATSIKGSKSERAHSVPPTPPPFKSSMCQSKIQPESRPSRVKCLRGQFPIITDRFYDRYGNVNSGGRCPLIPMPPPPPPPFRMSGMKFAVRGDNVRIQNSHSSPELGDADLSSKKETSDGNDGGDVAGPSVFCPSQDVNIKADTVIARLRDEKINSLTGKQKLGHGLGP